VVPNRLPNASAPRISLDGTILILEATRLGSCTAVCPAVADHAMPDIHSANSGVEDWAMKNVAHRRWLKERGQLIDDRLCKPAAACATGGRTLSQARCDILRPDGLLPANDSAKALLLNQ
jgi:hypothetical protein